MLWAQEHTTVPAYVIDFLRRLQSSRRDSQMLDDDAIIADIVTELRGSGKALVTLSEIQDRVNEKGRCDLPYKRLGHFLRQFGATAVRTNQGYKFNLQTISTEFLQSRYGL